MGQAEFNHTRDSLDRLDENAVRDIADGLRISDCEKLTKAELMDEILQKQKMKDEVGPKVRTATKGKVKASPSPPPAESVQARDEGHAEGVSEAGGAFLKSSGSDDRSLIIGSNRLLLPTSINELSHFWERGYICHPAVLMELVKATYPDYDPCTIIRFEKIGLSDRYDVGYEVLIEFDPPTTGGSQVISTDWMTPCNSIRRLVVKDAETKEFLLRTLNASHKGFSSDFEVSIEKQESVYQVGPDTVLTADEGLFVDPKIVSQFKRLDSYLGGLAVSSFIERKLFLQFRHVQKEIDLLGRMGRNILEPERRNVAKDTEWKVLDFISDRVSEGMRPGGALSNNNEAVNYSNRMLEFVAGRETGPINENAIRYNERAHKVVIDEIRLHLKKREIRDAIEKIPKKDGANRDPFLIFAAMIGNFINLRTPASNDRQSFLFSLEGFHADGLVTAEEMVVVGYLLGSFLSYPLVWNPVIEDENLSDPECVGLLRMRLSDKSISHVLDSIVPSIPLLAMHRYAVPNSGSSVDRPVNSKTVCTKGSYLKIVAEQDSLRMVDDDLQLFENWLKKDPVHKKDILGFLLNLESYSSGDMEKYVKTWFDLKDLDSAVRKIRSGMLNGGFSDVRRKLLRTLCKGSS